MHIVLIGAELEENLAVRYLAPPLLNAGHDVEIVAYDDPSCQLRLARELAAKKPDVIGMSVAFQHRLTDFRSLTQTLRSAGLESIVVWGGHIPTARAGRILEAYPEVDFIVRHDGEETLLELVDALEGGALEERESGREVAGQLLLALKEIPGLAFRLPGGKPGMTPARPAPRDLDEIETPWRQGKPAHHGGLGFSPILGSRGCWGSCTYCSIQTYHRGRGGPRVRLREPAAIATEMAEMYHHDQTRIFCFHDDNFFLPKPNRTLSRLREIRTELDRRGVGRIGLVAKCRPDELSPELLKEARKMGLIRVYVGIENGSQAGLDHLGRKTSVDTCSRALQMLREAGVYACYNVLLFEPDTTLADVTENLVFLNENSDFPWNFCRTEVYPGSFMEASLKQQRRLRGGLEGMTYTIADPRAELLFRISAIAFSGRNFGTQSTANAASGVGYLAAVLDHFYGGRQSRAFLRDSNEVICRLGSDTLAKLTLAHDFVANGEVRPEVISRFAADLARQVAVADADFWPALETLRIGMNRYGSTRAPALLAPSTGRQALAKTAALLAAAGLAGVACDGTRTTVMDPVPGDLRDNGDVSVNDPVPPDVMVFDPLPPDVIDATVQEDIMVMDPLPPDVVEQDYMVVDPLPPDVVEQDYYMVADPPAPDIVEQEDIMVMDPLPPDIIEEDAGSKKDVPPPVDPPPPDQSAYDAADKPPTTPGALPLDRGFRVKLASETKGREIHFTARCTGVPEATLQWLCRGGTLEATGSSAIFRPSGTGAAMVQVHARVGQGLLDAATWLPDIV